ncbi:lytic transglycosylase [Bacillus phage vB_BauM_KLEB27-3]|nr:lytic transglycosylase [Bacillus phage vB_BauM_KLEB27-3]
MGKISPPSKTKVTILSSTLIASSLLIGGTALGITYSMNKSIEDLKSKITDQNKNLELQRGKIEDLNKMNKELNTDLNQKEKENKINKKKLEKKSMQLKKKDKKIKDQNFKIKDLEKKVSLKKHKEALASSKPKQSTVRNVKTASVSRENVSSSKELMMTATAYTAFCDTGCTGITATGRDLSNDRSAKVIAVDPSVIPLGTNVYVEGYGYAVAADTGGAIKGHKIDLHVPTESQANQWGVQKVKVKILN